MKAGRPKWVRRLLMMSRSASEFALAVISLLRSSKNFMSSGGNRVVKERSTRSAGVLGIGVAGFVKAHYVAKSMQKQVLLTLKTNLSRRSSAFSGLMPLRPKEPVGAVHGAGTAVPRRANEMDLFRQQPITPRRNSRTPLAGSGCACPEFLFARDHRQRPELPTEIEMGSTSIIPVPIQD